MVYAIVIFGVLFVDQLTKALAYGFAWEHITLLPNLLELDYLPGLNTGMAFGLLGNKPWAIPVFLTVTALAMVVLVVLLVRVKRSRRFLRTALALVLCGALGNFIDRAVLEGVRDFISLSVGNVSFLNFNCNVADIAITAGAVMLILDLLFIDEEAVFRSGKKKQENSESEQEVAEPKSDGAEGERFGGK